AEGHHDESCKVARVHDARLRLRNRKVSRGRDASRGHVRRGKRQRVPARDASPQSHAGAASLRRLAPAAADRPRQLAAAPEQKRKKVSPAADKILSAANDWQLPFLNALSPEAGTASQIPHETRPAFRGPPKRC